MFKSIIVLASLFLLSSCSNQVQPVSSTVYLNSTVVNGTIDCGDGTTLNYPVKFDSGKYTFCQVFVERYAFTSSESRRGFTENVDYTVDFNAGEIVFSSIPCGIGYRIILFEGGD